MNSIVSDAIAADVATLTRVQDPPAADSDLGYGTDLVCLTDLDPNLAELDPFSPAAIVQDIIHRYLTPRGALEDDPDYGFFVQGQLNRGMTRRELRAISGAMQGEAQKDDRVDRAEVSLMASLDSTQLDIEVRIVPAVTGLQPFEFTFSVTSSAVLMGTITNA